ncbi:hypothetical protein BOTBODRAFT_205329 [Botryobasidium botryosum FD-172 SS1]|uniref:Uncharacterized protein n=1 Tax=Botryobasidium botryosum (strain FD-172 SS1) TaxID=930990 RepID=A0A067N0H4_BOTB1|nr:hypothetical protein BOTBODRAFT_205329 [Botryobasidium botryosum FD-172 SS1]
MTLGPRAGVIWREPPPAKHHQRSASTRAAASDLEFVRKPAMKLPYRLPARNLLSLQAASPSKFTRNAHTRRPLPTASHTSVYSTLKRPASRLEGLPRHTFTALQRPFHTSQPRRDIFFVAFPALKAHLLSITRFTLVLLPFVWRYRVWKKYPRTSLALLQIPIFAVCIVVALALDQSPRTHRWRLLMMSTHEEMEWAQHRKL